MQTMQLAALPAEEQHEPPPPYTPFPASRPEPPRYLCNPPRPQQRRGPPQPVLEAFRAIVYDRECTAKSCLDWDTSNGTLADYRVPRNVLIPYVSSAVFEHMLLVEYGFPPSPISRAALPVFRTLFLRDVEETTRFAGYLTTAACLWKQGRNLDSIDWAPLVQALVGKYSCCRAVPHEPKTLEVGDAATMLYWFHTRRTPVAKCDRMKGWTGYTGVLQEMIDEIPTRGPDRLARKLSLDVRVLIPKVVNSKEKREQMLSIARTLAGEYGLSIHFPEPGSKGKLRKWWGTMPRFLRVGSEDSEDGSHESKEKQV